MSKIRLFHVNKMAARLLGQSTIVLLSTTKTREWV